MGTGVRIKDIAARMGISASTVSLVLRGRGDENRISRETQKRVIQTAGEMGYPVRKSPGMGEDRRSFAIFLPSDSVVGPIQAVMKGIEKFRAKSGSGDKDLAFAAQTTQGRRMDQARPIPLERRA